ncbi:MerR family transcriptional regulator [Plantactinospora endophytica]|uniref:HTH merR-type domain-containing protein n=1 Tax=Plantactinospora endophytica TaxID=673535 RepID=A0ABQ4ECH3_9ACTN|nr:MerR family transcriptional regulator [Plantactinospora endophytica]GIG92433.1 hypothetical protein Pen02_73690 [Plantactinospora endophytica]
MTGRDATGRRWSIGELARLTGTTVRALHHYDEIGLLRAAERTTSGHRRYTERDLRRLYRIRALRGLGLSLEEIAAVLADTADDLAAMRELLTAQLRGLETHAIRLRQLTERLHGLLGQLESASMPGPDQFLTTLEMISVFDTSFSTEQREQLAERRAALGPDGVETARLEWAGLVAELLRHVQEDSPTDDPAVRALVDRWDALADRFHPAGADGERTRTVARRMWAENSEEIGRRLPWPTDQMRALVDYLDRVRVGRDA